MPTDGLLGELCDRLRPVRNDAKMANFSIAAGLGDSNRDRVLVRVEPDENPILIHDRLHLENCSSDEATYTRGHGTFRWKRSSHLSLHGLGQRRQGRRHRLHPDRDRQAQQRRPQAWLAQVLERIPDHKINRIDELLPWNTAPGADEEADA